MGEICAIGMFGPSHCFQRRQFASSSIRVQSLATAPLVGPGSSMRLGKVPPRQACRKIIAEPVLGAGYTTFTALLHDKFLRPTAQGAFPSSRRHVVISEFRSKPRPQLPNRHRSPVDVDPKPLIRPSGACHPFLAHENDMTGTPQFINPRRDTWARGPQGILVSVRDRNKRANANKRGIRHSVLPFLL